MKPCLGDVRLEIPAGHIGSIIRRKLPNRHLRSIRCIPTEGQRDGILHGTKLLLRIGQAQLRAIEIHLRLLYLERRRRAEGLLPHRTLIHPLVHLHLILIHLPQLHETLVAHESTVHTGYQGHLRRMQPLLHLRHEGRNTTFHTVLYIGRSVFSGSTAGRTDGIFHPFDLSKIRLLLLLARAVLRLLPEIRDGISQITDRA